MAVTKTMGYQFLAEEALGTHDLDTHTLKCALMDNSFAFNPATHSTYGDCSGSEVASGNGYTTGGETLTTVTSTETASGSTVACDDVSWTASGGSIGVTGSAIIYNDSHANKTVICCIDYGADYTTTVGTVFQIDLSTNGIFTKSNSA